MPSQRTLTRLTREDAVIGDLLHNPRLRLLLDVLPRVGLPRWWIAGPALAASIWNRQDDRPGALGIERYQVIYHDPRDLTFAAEDHAAAHVRAALEGSGIDVVVQNVARTHLRLEEELGIHTAPFAGAEEFVGAFASTAACLGVTHDGDGHLTLLAPHGVEDVYARRTVPAPARTARQGTAPVAGSTRRIA